eukprot:Nitzschia sp. Nitz4//scaffold12_size214221//4994//6859//NITZ4_001472-RA/size214221-processed-gene-0.284-mRNA-1//1//CDS//3329534936//4137//frame0
MTSLRVVPTPAETVAVDEGSLTVNSQPRVLPTSPEGFPSFPSMESLQSMLSTNVPLVACALLASLTTGGVSYAFGLYGNALKKNLHLTQAQLETISSATFVAGLFSWVPGMFVDRFGFRLGVSLGGASGATSVMIYWAVATKYIPFASTEFIVALLSFLGVTTFLSCALVTGSVFKIISCNCGPGTKGSAVGIAKGYVGLGSGVYACLFESIRSPSTSDLDFLPMCAFFFLAAASLPSWFVLPDKNNELRGFRDAFTPRHFQVLYFSLCSLAVAIVGRSIAGLVRTANSQDSDTTPNYAFAFIVFVLWWGPIIGQVLLPVGSRGGPDMDHEELDALLQESDRELNTQGVLTAETEMEPVSNLLEDEEEFIDDPVVGVGSEEEHGVLVDRNLQQMLRSPTAWLLLWTTTILVGGGIVETNNLGQMVESLHFPSVVTPASLSLFSVSQSAGRVATGAISEAALRFNTKQCGLEKGIPRPFFLAVASMVGVIAHLLLAVSSEEFFFVVGIALSGFAFGSAWPMMVLMVGEIYGTRNLAANYMFFDGFTSAAGTVMLSKILTQAVYDSHTDAHDAVDDDAMTCFGGGCFRLTHVVIALLSASGIVSSLMLQRATLHVYEDSNRHH